MCGATCRHMSGLGRIRDTGCVFFDHRDTNTMRISALSLFAAAVVVVGSSFSPVQADETGMASIHSWRKVGKKTCFVDHSHAGSGNGSTKKAAEMAAVSSWVSFTALEYGSSWADYRAAVAKVMRCGANGPGSWSCDLDAIPCRPY